MLQLHSDVIIPSVTNKPIYPISLLDMKGSHLFSDFCHFFILQTEDLIMDMCIRTSPTCHNLGLHAIKDMHHTSLSSLQEHL